MDKLLVKFSAGDVNEVLGHYILINASFKLVFSAEDVVKAMDEATDIILNLEAQITHEVQEERRSVPIDLSDDDVEETLKYRRHYL
jgi:hypothetical protein